MPRTTEHMDQEALNTLLILEPPNIDRLPWRPVPGCPGVDEKELWRFDDVVHALIRYAPGSSTPGRPHPAAHHHIWVIAGAATVAGRRIVAGSYAHIPPATEHPIGDVGADGCTILQMHRPRPPREADDFVRRGTARP